MEQVSRVPKICLTVQDQDSTRFSGLLKWFLSPQIGEVFGTLTASMPGSSPTRLYRFGTFEVDAATSELRRQGIRIKLHAQPFRILFLLLERPGELLTREEIAQALWPDGTFVDFEQGVNSAVNRLREALKDTAANPRYVETLARRGYRFIAPVERVPRVGDAEPASAVEDSDPEPAMTSLLTSEQDLPKVSYPVVQGCFVGLQLMYVAFYVGALGNIAEIADLFAPVPHATLALDVLVVTAALMIAVRASVLSDALMHTPRARQKFLRIWPALLVVDELWSLAPFLLLHHMSFGLALACTPLLVYSPFAQRSLVLMGAGSNPEELRAR
jgi:DNA-binding winged helix-turn-helix (wHTH) protein